MKKIIHSAYNFLLCKLLYSGYSTKQSQLHLHHILMFNNLPKFFHKQDSAGRRAEERQGAPQNHCLAEFLT